MVDPGEALGRADGGGGPGPRAAAVTCFPRPHRGMVLAVMRAGNLAEPLQENTASLTGGSFTAAVVDGAASDAGSEKRQECISVVARVRKRDPGSGSAPRVMPCACGALAVPCIFKDFGARRWGATAPRARTAAPPRDQRDVKWANCGKTGHTLSSVIIELSFLAPAIGGLDNR